MGSFSNKIKATLNKILMRPQIWQISSDAKQLRLHAKNVSQSLASLQLESAILQKKLDLVEATLDQQQGAIIRAVQDAQAEAIEAIDRKIADQGGSAKDYGDNQFRQFEALLGLLLALRLEHVLPQTRNWAASPDFLIELFRRIKEERPAVVVELGGGVSTIVAAAALRSNQAGQLYSLDHDPDFLSDTERQICLHGLSEWVKTFHAPLTEWVPPSSSTTKAGNQFRWYDVPPEVAQLPRIDLLVVDGPPAASSRRGRYPAVPFFYDQLEIGSRVMLDDSQREDERFIVKAWTAEFGMKSQQIKGFEKGLALLTKVEPSETAQIELEKVQS